MTVVKHCCTWYSTNDNKSIWNAGNFLFKSRKRKGEMEMYSINYSGETKVCRF